MTTVPNSVLYAAIARERTSRFRAGATVTASHGHPSRRLRVRVGRMLISVGTVVSGDCIELHPRRSTRQPHAA